MKAYAAVALTLILMLLNAVEAHSKAYSTLENALSRAFPAASKIEKKTVFLSPEEKRLAEELTGEKLDSRLYTFYVAGREGKAEGYAFVGARVIRTKQAVFMVVISPGKKISSVEVLAFYEPEEYLPGDSWFRQFVGKMLNVELFSRRGIHAVSGATLSSYGITMEARKALAVLEAAGLAQPNEK